MKWLRGYTMKKFFRREQGQSIIIIAGAMVVLVALLALVVDAGNAYVQRRQVQNAIDSGAQAGALALAQTKTNGAISAAVTTYVRANGLDPSRVRAYYVVQDASGNNIVVRTNTIDAYGLSNTPPQTISVGGAPLPVIGVQVEGDKLFPTYFAGVIGFRQMQTGGGAAAYASKGACSASNMFPLIISMDTFVDENADGTPDVHYEQTDPTYSYRIWENKQSAPGNFGWIFWRNDTSSTTTLVENMNDTSRSGNWAVGDWVNGNTGISASSNVRGALDSRINGTLPSQVTIPVYDAIQGTGNNTQYRIKAFARFRITGYTFQGNNKYVDGKFQEWVDPQAEGGCTNFGVVSVKVRPPIDVKRVLAGSIKLQKLTLTQTTATTAHVPVDVVNILDISGSMNDSFGSKTKLRAAKDALKTFNLNMLPAQGDQVSLVTYPRVANGTRYNYSCESSGNTREYYFGQMRAALTNNITSVNTTIEGLSADSYTPIADGLKVGRETVLGTGHNANSVAVVILASDGNMNVRLNGQRTGYDGYGTPPSCNQQAEQDALDQANLAKGDTTPRDGMPDTIIFTIAVGTDFNPAALQAIATRDTDATKPHYFRATDANSMASIYTQISQRVQQIGSETCRIITSEAFASGATVVIRNRNTNLSYTLQTTSNGEFVLPNADPGTYEIQSASVAINGLTYNVFTDGLGGAVLTSNPTVVVDTGSGTYKTDLFLKTNNTVSCGN